jgi:flagellar motor switch protein FliN/FliY
MMSDELMNQEEIDALLRGELEPKPSDQSELQIDNQLSSMEQDTLAEIGNISMGSAATALSMLVNKKVRITVPSVYISTPHMIKESYPIPCIIVNVQYLSGLQGENILVIRERDALVIGNLMMGEDGTSLPETIDELYLSAVTEAMNMMMGSAATAMSDLFSDTIDISPPTTERRDLSLDPLTSAMSDHKSVVIIEFRIEIDDLVDSSMLQIIDIEFAKEMVKKLMPQEEEEEESVSVSETPITEPPISTPSWSDLKDETPSEILTTQPAPSDLGNINVDLIRDIPVQVRAVLGRTRMTIDNILRLGPGHIMELESLHGEPIDVFANDTLIARGEVVVVGEQFGIRITEIAAQQERIVSVR